MDLTAVTRAPAGDGSPEPARPDRLEELRSRLAGLRRRIADACARSDRDAGDITLVAVTKTYPASDVRALAELGVRHIGENRSTELVDKQTALRERGSAALTWHYVGRIQTRQAGRIGRAADVVHSVDRVEVAHRLGNAAVESGRVLRVLIQLSFDGDPDRGGATAAVLPALADAVADTEGLVLSGVMGVPMLGADPWASYRELAAVANGIRLAHPDARWLSAGMSDDLEAAVAAGATHLRVGTALLGRRAR